MAALKVLVGEGMDMLLSLSSDKSTLPSFTARRPSVECCDVEDTAAGKRRDVTDKTTRFMSEQNLACLSPFGDDEVRQELVKLLPLHVHRRYLHVSLKHLAADGLTVHCVYRARSERVTDDQWSLRAIRLDGTLRQALPPLMRTD